MNILKTSGLYDECAEINVGCLGIKKNLDFLKKDLIARHEKINLKFYSPIPMLYEYPTLSLIEDDNTEYLGFYFHLKGVTRPKDPMQVKERQYLNDMMLGHWRHHVFILETGYDIASLNYLTIPKRFSGNYFWFNRKIIDKLPRLETLDHNNRFFAEKWIYMNKNNGNENQ